MIILIIISLLVSLNFILLKLSCDSSDSNSKKNNKKVKVNTPKFFTEKKTESNPLFADK